MPIKNLWKAQEDSTLKNILDSMEILYPDGNVNWHEVSQRFKEVLSIYKTPKQCFDRWKNHLQPNSAKESEWSYEDQLKLFELQESQGNRWTYIASKLPGKKDIAVKNYFYATLRKSIRLINHFICQHRHEGLYKSLKLFPQNCIGKIIAQDQQKKTDKMRVTKNNISESARQIKLLLLEISREKSDRSLIQKAIQQVSQFNRNCRRLRCKKRKSSLCGDQDEDYNQKFESTNQSQKSCKAIVEQPKVKIEENQHNQAKNYNYPSIANQYHPMHFQAQLYQRQLQQKEREAEIANDIRSKFPLQNYQVNPQDTNKPSSEAQLIQSRQYKYEVENFGLPNSLNQPQRQQYQRPDLQFQGILSLPLLFSSPERFVPRSRNNTFEIQRELQNERLSQVQF